MRASREVPDWPSGEYRYLGRQISKQGIDLAQIDPFSHIFRGLAEQEREVA